MSLMADPLTPPPLPLNGPDIKRRTFFSASLTTRKKLMQECYELISKNTKVSTTILSGGGGRKSETPSLVTKSVSSIK